MGIRNVKKYIFSNSENDGLIKSGIYFLTPFSCDKYCHRLPVWKKLPGEYKK